MACVYSQVLFILPFDLTEGIVAARIYPVSSGIALVLCSLSFVHRCMLTALYISDEGVMVTLKRRNTTDRIPPAVVAPTNSSSNSSGSNGNSTSGAPTTVTPPARARLGANYTMAARYPSTQATTAAQTCIMLKCVPTTTLPPLAAWWTGDGTPAEALRSMQGS